MKTLAILALAPMLLLAQREERTWDRHEDETLTRSFPLTAAAGAQKLLVDNVNGFVHVTGYSGAEVRVTVKKRIDAESDAALAEAKRDVKLDLSQQGNFVRIYADGPFRSSNGVNYRGDRYYGYRVRFDCEVQVPAAAELVLKTINGAIEVKNSSGDFEINGLNGGIDMQGISGAGKVKTLNGALAVQFTRNPAKASEFHTLNGKMDIYFQPGLNADLSFHSLHGGIWSDFEIGPRPAVAGQAESRDGKFIYRNNGNTVGRAGKGGPELKFDALNGAIELHSKKAI
jgi:hypothetical protein